MHRVLAHIDANLDQPLELEALAAVAHISAFHFHRLFSAWMGETLGDVGLIRDDSAILKVVAMVDQMESR